MVDVQVEFKGSIVLNVFWFIFFFFQAEDGIRDIGVTGVQTCALPILQGLLRIFFEVYWKSQNKELTAVLVKGYWNLYSNSIFPLILKDNLLAQHLQLLDPSPYEQELAKFHFYIADAQRPRR